VKLIVESRDMCNERMKFIILRQLPPRVVKIAMVAAIVLIVTYLLGYSTSMFHVSSSSQMSFSSAVDDRRCYSATYAVVNKDLTVDGTPTVVSGRSFVFAEDYLSGQGFPLVFNDPPTDLSTRRTTVNDVVFVTASDSWVTTL